MRTLSKASLIIEALEVPSAIDTKMNLFKSHVIPTMWQLKDRLQQEGYIGSDQCLAFFCPVYFAGQKIVEKLLWEKNEEDEVLVFPLMTITDQKRVHVGIEQMKLLGIKNPESKLENVKMGKESMKGLPLYSTLIGSEGVGSGRIYCHIAHEFVQLGCFQIVPKKWMNWGDPLNQSYKFPGEEGYSPYWRVPTFEEFKGLAPKMAMRYKETANGIIKTDFSFHSWTGTSM